MQSGHHIALLIDTSTTWGSELIRGVLSYARRRTNWIVHFEPRGKYEVISPPGGRTVQGLIARVTTRRLAEFLNGLGLATVNVSWYRHDDLSTTIAHCTTDVRRAGQMCAAHLLERGFRHYAYCGGLHRPYYVDELKLSFFAALRRAGHDCHLFEPHDRRQMEAWQIEYTELSEWVTRLPKPIGVLAFDAVRGRQLTEVCRRGNIAVPEQVAVLAGEHDDLWCESSVPPLSSIDIAPRRVGYRAAELLDQILHTNHFPPTAEQIPPGRITTRQSTDTTAIDDPIIATAVRFIHEHVRESIQVKDVLRGIPLSRRVLEQKFRTAVGRTPAAEIRRKKVELAMELLEKTSLPLTTIAQHTGVQHAEVLTRMFQRETGMSPSLYRNHLRAKSEGNHSDSRRDHGSLE